APALAIDAVLSRPAPGVSKAAPSPRRRRKVRRGRGDGGAVACLENGSNSTLEDERSAMAVSWIFIGPFEVDVYSLGLIGAPTQVLRTYEFATHPSSRPDWKGNVIVTLRERNG